MLQLHRGVGKETRRGGRHVSWTFCELPPPGPVRILEVICRGGLAVVRRVKQEKGISEALHDDDSSLILSWKEMQKDMDEKMDVLINIQKNSKV